MPATRSILPPMRRVRGGQKVRAVQRCEFHVSNRFSRCLGLLLFMHDRIPTCSRLVTPIYPLLQHYTQDTREQHARRKVLREQASAENRGLPNGGRASAYEDQVGKTSNCGPMVDTAEAVRQRQ